VNTRAIAQGAFDPDPNRQPTQPVTPGGAARRTPSFAADSVRCGQPDLPLIVKL
jgi:hypothetical protein